MTADRLVARHPPGIELDHLLKVRVVVARVGEMDLARWWNTNGQLGRLGAAAVRRGLPRTHYFAQARSVFAVAMHRCDEVFSPPDGLTLWRLPPSIETQFEARWEHWLDNANEWREFFEAVAAISAPDLGAALTSFDLADPGALARASSLELKPGRRDLQVPGVFSGTTEDVTLLALAFSSGAVGSLVVPHMKVAE